MVEIRSALVLSVRTNRAGPADSGLGMYQTCLGSVGQGSLDLCSHESDASLFCSCKCSTLRGWGSMTVPDASPWRVRERGPPAE